MAGFQIRLKKRSAFQKVAAAITAQDIGDIATSGYFL
jgi:hypothetical protein